MLINFGDQISPKFKLLKFLEFCLCQVIYFGFTIKCYLGSVSTRSLFNS